MWNYFPLQLTLIIEIITNNIQIRRWRTPYRLICNLATINCYSQEWKITNIMLDYWYQICFEVRPYQGSGSMLEVQALPLPPSATTGKFWQFWDSDNTNNTFISNSSETLSNCYHHSVSFLHKNRSFNRINCVCFITQLIL